MKVTADTNILIRAVVRDDVRQADSVVTLLKDAELIAVTLPSLCEFVWVLRTVYSFGLEDIADAIEALLNATNVEVNRAAVDAGLAILRAGGDFADGVIAYEGIWLGASTFASFDKKAVALIAKQGQETLLLD